LSVDEEGGVGKQRLRAKLERDCGALLMNAMHDPLTVEVLLNADGKLWQERLGEPMTHIGEIKSIQAQGILRSVAAYHDEVVTREHPRLECEWPLDGSRFAGQLPPIVREVTFAIRKKASSVFTLDQYVEREVMTFSHAEALREAVQAHKNILVIGGTGSGKTTLINALIAEMVRQNPHERFVTIEDTAELQCTAPNKVQYYASANVSLADLVKGTLRMRPDRILVGEVRDGTALDLVDAWNTGHDGGAGTLHANSPLAALNRLRSLITRNPAAPAEIEPLIGEAVHVVVHITRTASRSRRVQAILAIDGYADGHYATRNL
jgi:P-type conjugative transfer ATPase TrbB